MPSIPAEIAEVIQQERTQNVDVNVLVLQISNKAKDPQTLIPALREALAFVETFEEKRLQAFKRQVDAVIDAKLRDPDEVEKRKNNFVRRILKLVVGGCSIAGLALGGYCAATGVGFVVTTLLIGAGILGLSQLGPLASGESVTSGEVIRVIRAAKSWISASGGPEAEAPREKEKNRKGKK